MMESVQIYVNVDDQGNIVEAYTGANIVATEDFNFYFFKPKEIAESIHEYKVVMNGMKADLVLKEGGVGI